MIFDKVFKVIDVWATYIVKMTLAIDLFDLIFKVIWNCNLTQLLIASQYALCLPFYTIGCNFFGVMFFVFKPKNVGLIMLSTN
jgi:hypothetical protein